MPPPPLQGLPHGVAMGKSPPLSEPWQKQGGGGWLLLLEPRSVWGGGLEFSEHLRAGLILSRGT